jgi:acyl-CoA synthetase (AMP-forming)/AMP-acid ligase II/acyl carrier protein
MKIDRPNPPPTMLADLLRLQARQRPQAPAILAPDRPAMSYARLCQSIDSLQSGLRQAGLSRQDRVAVVLPNGPELAVAILATLCSAVCAPLNEGYRLADYRFYLQDLGAKALILWTGHNSPARTAALDMGVTLLEASPRDDAAGSFDLKGGGTEISDLESPCRPEDTALILHTSGTTSRPKIVPLSQRNLCCSAFNVAASLALGPGDRCLNVMPLFHIHGIVAALLASLAAGASVACTPGFSEESFLGWLKEIQPTWYTAVPTIHQAVLSRAGQAHDAAFSHGLRLIRSSSAALAPQVMAALEKKFGVPVIEAYGMTEAAHQMACNPLPPLARKPRSVGRAAGPEIAILGPDGGLLGDGTEGEIAIRGANVTAGYENNPAANRDAYTNSWFRTGDQGFLDPDQYLFITGRIKEIINRGGEKVSPREIDEALMDHPAVRQAVAFAVPHETLGEDIAAAVVVRKDDKVSEKQLRDFAFQRLAPQKVPSQIVIVDAIPKGATGKLQRIGLSDKLRQVLQRPFVAPRNELEAIVAESIAEVLNQEKVGVHDSFFYLGGDSLRATVLMSRLCALFQVDLPIITVFRHQTAAELAEAFAASGHIDLQTIDTILADLGALSEQEAQRLLDQEKEKRNGPL